MHCLIVRGDAGAYVRRWAPDTRLNGAAFDDALLRSGDRLSIGPIDFCVVETGSESAPTPQVISSDSETKTANTEARAGTQLLPQEPSATLPAADGCASPTISSSDVDVERAKLEEQKRLLQEEWAALNDRCRRFEDQCREALDAQAGAESRLVAKQTELDQWEARLVQAQQTLEAGRQEIEQQARSVAAEREELERLRHALEAERNRFAAESSETDQRLTAQAAELTRQRIELSQQQKELELLRQQILDQQARWQALVQSGITEAARHSTAAAPMPPASPAATMEIGGTAGDDEESPVDDDADSDAYSSCGDEVSDEADSTTSASLDDDRPYRSLPENNWHECNCPPEESDAASLRLEDVLRRLGRRESNAAEQASANTIRQAEAEPCERLGASDAEYSFSTRRPSSCDALGSAVESDPEDAGVNEPREFNRWSAEEAERADPDEPVSSPANTSACPANRGERTAMDSGEETSGEDDIDAYMADLMRRLGKSHQPASRQQATEPSPRRDDHLEDKTQQKPAATEECDAQSDTKRRPLSELAPRAVAPEKQLNMDAMRELANQSTRSALDQHAWRSLWHTARSHLTMTATMGIVGLGLLWLHFHWIANKLALYSGLAALGFGGFLMLQYLWTACRLLTHKRSGCNDNTSQTRGETGQPAAATGVFQPADATGAAEVVDAVDEQAMAPARIDLDRLDALVAHARARSVGPEPCEPTDEPR